MSGTLYEVQVEYPDYTAWQFVCTCAPTDLNGVIASDDMGFPAGEIGAWAGPFACGKCGALSADAVTPTVQMLEVGANVSVRLGRYDASTGHVIPWTITGKIAAPVNREGYAGTVPGVRLTDASCDDPKCDHSRHAVALTTPVMVVIEMVGA